MNDVERLGISRLMKTRRAELLVGAGVVGIITLTAILLLRKRWRSQKQRREIKDTVAAFSKVKDQTAALIGFSETIAGSVVDPEEVIETATLAADHFQATSPADSPSLKDESADTFAAIAAVAEQQK